MKRFLRKVRLTLCIWGMHCKIYSVGGYRCKWCGKYVEGYKTK